MIVKKSVLCNLCFFQTETRALSLLLSAQMAFRTASGYLRHTLILRDLILSSIRYTRITVLLISRLIITAVSESISGQRFRLRFTVLSLLKTEQILTFASVRTRESLFSVLQTFFRTLQKNRMKRGSARRSPEKGSM